MASPQPERSTALRRAPWAFDVASASTACSSETAAPGGRLHCGQRGGIGPSYGAGAWKTATRVQYSGRGQPSRDAATSCRSGIRPKNTISEAIRGQSIESMREMHAVVLREFLVNATEQAQRAT